MTPEQQLRETRVKLWAEVDGTNRLVETSMLAIAEAVPAVGRLLDPIPDEVWKRAEEAALTERSGLPTTDAIVGFWSVIRAWLIGGDE